MAPLRFLSAGLALGLALGCAQDPNTQPSVIPPEGIEQPGADGGATLDATTACERIVAAETDARGRLGCDAPKAPHACPDYVRVAGASTCGAYLRSTVDACVTRMSGFQSCSDFDTHPCVATAIRESCVASSAAPEGGPDGGAQDDGSVPVEAGPGRDASSPEGGPGDTLRGDGGLSAEAGLDSGRH